MHNFVTFYSIATKIGISMHPFCVPNFKAIGLCVCVLWQLSHLDEEKEE